MKRAKQRQSQMLHIEIPAARLDDGTLVRAEYRRRYYVRADAAGPPGTWRFGKARRNLRPARVDVALSIRGDAFTITPPAPS